MQQIALMNDEARFGQVADDRLDDIVAENAERNTEFMKLYFDNAEFGKAIKEAARKRAYRIITDPARDEALARLRAEMARETGASRSRCYGPRARCPQRRTARKRSRSSTPWSATASGSCARSGSPRSSGTPVRPRSTTPGWRRRQTDPRGCGLSCSCCAAQHWKRC